ncbi:MAG: hypothetical protein IT306_18835 [Chloroflexi bacterium]|nr:hypothetical protein [Chloroflexota bacterium]
MTEQPDDTSVEVYELRARLWARAHAEAARAVVAMLLGGRVVSVELWSGPPVGGRVQLAEDDGDAPLSDHGLVRRVALLLAGPIAETIALSPAGAIANEPASMAAHVLVEGMRDPSAIDLDTDLGKVAQLLAAHFGPAGEAPAAAASDHLPLGVEECLREHWEGVQMVVAALLRTGRLTEDDFRGLVALALPNAPTADLLGALPERTAGG